MEQRGGGVGSGEVDSATQITCTQSGEQVIPQGKPGAFLKNWTNTERANMTDAHYTPNL